MMYIIDALNTMLEIEELTFLFNLFLSIIIGTIIGIERESRGKDAGISTHALVIMGSMLFTFLSINIDSPDKGRIAAQVVTGIGFLGAGLILKDGTTVRNLTTAASLWFSAALGMAIGFGFYAVAIFGMLAGVVVLHIPHVMRRDRDFCISQDDEKGEEKQ